MAPLFSFFVANKQINVTVNQFYKIIYYMYEVGKMAVKFAPFRNSVVCRYAMVLPLVKTFILI